MKLQSWIGSLAILAASVLSASAADIATPAGATQQNAKVGEETRPQRSAADNTPAVTQKSAAASGSTTARTIAGTARPSMAST